MSLWCWPRKSQISYLELQKAFNKYINLVGKRKLFIYLMWKGLIPLNIYMWNKQVIIENHNEVNKYHSESWYFPTAPFFSIWFEIFLCQCGNAELSPKRTVEKLFKTKTIGLSTESLRHWIVWIVSLNLSFTTHKRCQMWTIQYKSHSTSENFEF